MQTVSLKYKDCRTGIFCLMSQMEEPYASPVRHVAKIETGVGTDKHTLQITFPKL
jgi:hypothetical protein